MRRQLEQVPHAAAGEADGERVLAVAAGFDAEDEYSRPLAPHRGGEQLAKMNGALADPAPADRVQITTVDDASLASTVEVVTVPMSRAT